MISFGYWLFYPLIVIQIFQIGCVSSVYLQSHSVSVQSAVYHSPQWNIFRFILWGFFPFDVILEVISSFLSPVPRLTAPSPSLSKVLAAWRIVWTCIDPMWDYSWVIGELDWATSHQGRLTTCCLLGCHFSRASDCWFGGCPLCSGHWTMDFYITLLSYGHTQLICGWKILHNKTIICLMTYIKVYLFSIL